MPSREHAVPLFHLLKAFTIIFVFHPQPWEIPRLEEPAGALGQPYVRLAHHGTLHYGVVLLAYTPWPWIRTFPLVHFGVMLYNQLEVHLAQSHEVSMQLLSEMAALTQHIQG